MKLHAALILALLAAGVAHAVEPVPSQTRGTQVPAAFPHVHVEIPRISLEAASYVATEIVHARVENVRPVFPEGGLPHTVYTVRVLSAMKGATTGTIDVTVAGAETATGSVGVDRAPRFEFNEEVVLFLWTAPGLNVTGILGLDRGTYRVSQDATGRRLLRGEHAQGVEINSFFDQVGAAWLRAEEKASQRKDK